MAGLSLRDRTYCHADSRRRGRLLASSKLRKQRDSAGAACRNGGLSMQEELIDRIYECSVVPELWPDVLDALAELTEARGGLLFSARRALHWTASETVRDIFDEYVSKGWFMRCERRVCLMSQTQPSFFVEHDFWTDEQLRDEPIYRDFFVPHGLGWSAGTGLQVPTGDNIVFSVERDHARGPIESGHVERLNALRPHLARSAFVTARLRMERAQGGADVLTALRLPAAVLDEGGLLVDANEAIEALPGLVTFAAHGRIRLADRRADEMLDDALAAVRSNADGATRSFPLRDAAGRPVMILHLVPVRRSAHDIFGPSHALLMLTPVSSERAPSAVLLKSLFDLTPSEARIATGIAMGRTLEDIADEGRVAVTTVRSQLRRVLEKTGCARQAEVAALLANVSIGPEIAA